MSDMPGVFLGMARVLVQSENDPEPRVIECPVYQVVNEDGTPTVAQPEN